jgi:MipA family protein
MRPLCRRPSILAIFLVAAGTAHAEQRLRPLWEVGVGIGALSLSDYPGSDEQSHYVFPIPYLVYRGDVLQVDRERVRGVLFKRERWDLDISASGSIPGRKGANRARAGMPDLDPTLELGPQLNIRLADNERYRLRFQLPVRNVRAVSRRLPEVGWLINPILNLQVENIGPGGGWKLAISGGPAWGDRGYHDYFYGVDAAQATPTRPAYSAKSGYSGTHLTVTLSKRYESIWVGAFVRVSDLHGSASEGSPLLRQKTSHMAGFGISWVFGRSGELVMSED